MRNSLVEHREQVAINLQKTPSLKSYLTKAITEAYPSARKVAIKQGQGAYFGVRQPNPSEYSETCPFTLEQLLNEDFYL